MCRPTKFDFRKANFKDLSTALVTMNYVLITPLIFTQGLNSFYAFLSSRLHFTSNYLLDPCPLTDLPYWIHKNFRLQYATTKNYKSFRSDVDLIHFKRAMQTLVKSLITRSRKEYPAKVEAALANKNFKPLESHLNSIPNPTQPFLTFIKFAPQLSLDLF